MIVLDATQRKTLLWAGLAVVLVGFDGSVLILALPTVTADFNAPVSALSNVGSAQVVGKGGQWPRHVPQRAIRDKPHSVGTRRHRPV